MATESRPSADRSAPGGGRRAPSRPAAGTRSTASPSEPGRRQTARKAQPIRYSPVRMGESRWRRHALVGLVALAVIVGVIGWYHYLTRPPRAVEIATTSPAPPDATAQQPSPPAQQAPARPPATAPGPLTLSAKELEVTLRAEGTLPHPSLGRYTGREVVWTGTVSAAGPVKDLLRVELKDPDGVRIVAWCDAGREVSTGAGVTIRGYLASRISSGFVLERCTVL